VLVSQLTGEKVLNGTTTFQAYESVDVIDVVDLSGSMDFFINGSIRRANATEMSKLDLLKNITNNFTDSLIDNNPRARVGLVAFNDATAIDNQLI